MKKSYDEPLFLLLQLCADDNICDVSKFTDIDGELGDYDDGGLTEDGDDL